MQEEAVLSTESCSNGRDMKKNSAKESIRCAENKLMKLQTYIIFEVLLKKYALFAFEYNMYHLTINKDIIFKDSMSGEHDLVKLNF